MLQLVLYEDHILDISTIIERHLKMSGKENVGRRGSEVQGHESVGRNEHTAEGKKDGRSSRVRRATFDDLKAIIDINNHLVRFCLHVAYPTPEYSGVLV